MSDCGWVGVCVCVSGVNVFDVEADIIRSCVMCLAESFPQCGLVSWHVLRHGFGAEERLAIVLMLLV